MYEDKNKKSNNFRIQLHTYLIIMHAHNQTFPHNWSTLVQTSHKIECNRIVQNEEIEQ